MWHLASDLNDLTNSQFSTCIRLIHLIVRHICLQSFRMPICIHTYRGIINPQLLLLLKANEDTYVLKSSLANVCTRYLQSFKCQFWDKILAHLVPPRKMSHGEHKFKVSIVWATLKHIGQVLYSKSFALSQHLFRTKGVTNFRIEQTVS